MGTAMVATGVVLAGIGLWRDVTRSSRDKGLRGSLGGSFRPVSFGGFTSGLPFYLAAVALLLFAP